MINLLETTEETTTKMPCLTGKLAVRVKINVTVMIITFIMFLHEQRILSAFIFLFVISLVAFVCILYHDSHVVRECFCGCICNDQRYFLA